MLDYLGSPLLTMLLTALVPTFAFSMLNLRFFNRLQVLAALAVAGLSGTLIFFLAQAAGWLTGFSLPALAWVLLGLANLYLWGEKFFFEALSVSKAARLAVPAFAVALAAACHFFSLAVFNGLLLLVLLTNVFDGLRERKRPKEGVLRPLDGKRNYEQNTRRDIKLASKPNIYLLLLESYHSAKAMQRLYGIDDGVTDELFRKHGFTLYDDVFCNAPCTLPSLATLLTGSLMAKPEQGNMVLDTLRENGYSAEFLDSGGYVFGRLARPGEYTTYEYPEQVVRLYAIFGPLFAQSRLLRKLVRGVDLFDTGGNFAEVYASLGRRIKLKSAGPRVFCLHFGAEHRDCGQPMWEADGSIFAARYRPAVARAQQEIRAVVELIDAHDPDALVIAVGDHGAMRHFNIWNGNRSMDEMIKSRNVSMEEVALDIFDTRLAIRWPVPHQTAGRVMSHVNLFRYVFAALGGGDALLQNLAPNVSALGGRFVFVKDGKPLEKISTFTAFGTVAEFERKIAAGTAGAEDYLGLAQFLAPRNSLKAIEVYREGHRRYPDNPDICQELGLTLASLRTRTALTYLEKGAALSGFSSKPLVEYLDYLWRFGAFDRAIEVFKSHKSLDNSCKALKIMLKTYYASGLLEEAEDCAAKILRSAKQPLIEFWTPFTEAALYFLDRGEFDKCLAVRESGFPGQEKRLRNYVLPIQVLKGLALIRQLRYPEAEEAFARLCRDHADPGAWSWIMLARMRELDGNPSAAVDTLINAAKEREKYCDNLLYQAGLTMQRNKITNQAHLPFRMVSLKMQQHYCEILEKEHILTDESSRSGLDYLHNGMLTGTSPLPWFNPQVFSIMNMAVWYAGADPLVSFVNYPGCEFSLRYHALQVCKPARSARLEFGDILDGLNWLLARPEEALAHGTPVAGEGERALRLQ